MIGSAQRQSSLFYVAFGREASLIKDDLLEPLDALLDDAQLVELVRQALAKRSKRSRVTGRRSIAPDRLLRCSALKHVKGWSFRELEREVRSSLVYRRFTRFDHDPIPDFSTFSRNFGVLGDDVTREINVRVVRMAAEEGIARGRRLRTDTTVVESNVHYPTDSTLLQDGIRVLTRAAKRLAAQCEPGAVEIVNRARATKHRVLEIHRAAKSFTEGGRERLKEGYGKLLRIAGGVMRKVEKLTHDVKNGEVPVVGSVASVLAAELEIEHFAPLVKRVIAQTKARVFGGDTHVKGKVLSIFEEHTQAIRKGKAHKPTEFGRLVRIDEVENGIVSNYSVEDRNRADQQSWTPALTEHAVIFGRAPKAATADRGFQSAKNEQTAKELGVEKVALPARGRLSDARRKRQKERWFRGLLRWRAGVEARIGTLKHRFGMLRAFYKGDRGFKRYVGWSIIANNLVSIARVRRKRETQKDARKKKAA